MSLLYKFVKYSGRIALPIYFGRLEINGKEHIPKNDPFIIAPNHQSAFLDAILMGVYNRKTVHFLTRADVFVKPFTKVLEALYMMPVYRIRDGYEKLSKNEMVFAKCEQILASGNPVLIFPEGNMDDGHFLRPLTKGTSRMAITTQLTLDADLHILPVGINYFHHDDPRYKCIINYGPTIKVRDYLEAYDQHKAKALIALRNDLAERIKKLMVIPEQEDYKARHLGLNRRNEHLFFPDLRKHLDQDKVRSARYYPSMRWMPMFLSLLNPLPIYGVHYVLYHIIKERQFDSSVKYALGFILCVIWWVLVYVIGTYFFNWRIGLMLTGMAFVGLILRSEIKKYTDPIKYPLYRKKEG